MINWEAIIEEVRCENPVVAEGMEAQRRGKDAQPPYQDGTREKIDWLDGWWNCREKYGSVDITTLMR